MLNILTKEEIVKYSELLFLPPKTTEELERGEIWFERISDVFAKDPDGVSQRLNNLDCYMDDPDVEEVGVEDSVYLLLSRGLAGDGIIMSDEKGDIGYCLIYPVSRELNGNLPKAYKKTRERSNWNKIAEYLTEMGHQNIQITEKDLFHHYDYAIKRRNMRRCGLGRLVLRYTLDKCLPDGCVAVGFIDFRSHGDSLVAATKAGCILGREVNPSPDGNHPSVLEIFSKKISYRFTGEEIPYHHVRDGIDRFPIAVKEIVNRKFPRTCLAFNFEKDKLCSVDVDNIV